MIQGIEPVYLEVGERIYRERSARQLTLATLAVRAGLHGPTHLSAIERGIQRCQLHTLQVIARELGLSMASLLGEEEGGGEA